MRFSEPVARTSLAVRTLARAGLLHPARPDRLLGMGLAVARFGTTVAAGVAAAAARTPGSVAVRDDSGSLTYRDLDARVAGLAGTLAERGVWAGSPVGVAARNGRDFIEAVAALGRIGADAILINPGTAPPELAAILAREGASVLLAEEIPPAGLAGVTILPLPELSRDLAAGPVPPAPRRRSRLVILTSGTTGAPRGAVRSAAGIEPAVSFLSAVPLRAAEPTVVAAPMFHAWGLAHLGLGLLLGSTFVLRRRFDPAVLLADVAATRATAVAAVPVMLERLLEVATPEANTATLRVVVVSGSALPGDLAPRFLTAFGPVLYNLYGSTEVATATLATPEDLAEDAGTAGRPLPGVSLRLVDEAGADVPVGQPGRIFVGSSLSFTGYTGGEDKPRLGSLVATGDIGRIDPAGRLVVAGRDDDMVISGGENIYPQEIEDTIARLPGVAEVAVVGVADAEFGQRLVAYVVALPGAVLEPEAVRGQVRSELSSYKVPREVLLTDALPRNATGKVLRRELAGLAPAAPVRPG
ncbi:MAG: AMP-binding protein [Mycobacteriales bacterium]